MKKEPVKRYSQALKQQVVREYEEGISIYSLRQKYGIGAHGTVERWIKKFGRSGYRTEVVHIQTVEDQLEFKAMKSRIKELESVSAQCVLENRMPETAIEVVDQSLDIDIKKNFGRKL